MTLTAISNGMLIDGTGREPVARGAVLVEDSRILAVGAEQDVLPGGRHTARSMPRVVRSCRVSLTATCISYWKATTCKRVC